MGRGRDLNPAVLAHIAARVAEGWNVGRLHRELSFVKRGTLKRKVSSIRRGDSGARKQYSARRTKLHGAAVAVYIQGAVRDGRSLTCMQDGLASHCGVSVTRETVRQYIKKELQKKCVRKYKTFYISRSQEERRAAWATEMIGRLALGGARTRIGRKTKRGLTLGKIVWTDEKLFRQAATGVSGQNSRFWMDEHNADGSRNSKRTAIRAQTPTGRALKLFRTQHNPGIMVSLAVSLETRILGPVFVEPGIKVSGAYYLEMLRDQWMPKLYAFPRLLSSPQSLWLEDGAPSHTARAVVTWQKKHFPLPVEKQAASSPDLSPLDFGIWNLIEAKLRGNRASDMDTLKADISRAVTQLNSDAEWPKVASVIHNFLPRLHRVQANAGSHCEG